MPDVAEPFLPRFRPRMFQSKLTGLPASGSQPSGFRRSLCPEVTMPQFSGLHVPLGVPSWRHEVRVRAAGSRRFLT